MELVYLFSTGGIELEYTCLLFAINKKEFEIRREFFGAYEMMGEMG